MWFLDKRIMAFMFCFFLAAVAASSTLMGIVMSRVKGDIFIACSKYNLTLVSSKVLLTSSPGFLSVCLLTFRAHFMLFGYRCLLRRLCCAALRYGEVFEATIARETSFEVALLSFMSSFVIR